MTMWVASLGVARFVWSRNRWPLGACGVFYVVTWLASALLPVDHSQLWLRGIWPVFNLAPVFLPLVAFVSPASTFTLDLASTQSRYPPHFFALPLNRRQLVLPFLAGAVLVALLLWSAGFAITDGRLLVGPQGIPPHRKGVSTGVEVVPFLLMSGIAWVQALVWMSFSRRGTRVWNLLAMVVTHLTVLILVSGHTISTPTGIATCVGSLFMAAGVAIWGIGRARRGDPVVREKGVEAPRARKRARALPRRLFPSPLAAQTWIEWQAHGARNRVPFLLLVPFMLALVVPATFAAHGGLQTPPSPATLLAMLIGLGVLIASLLTFVAFMNGPGAASFRSTFPWTRDDEFAMPAFFAALPLSTGDFAWAKMKTAARSTFTLVGLFVLYLLPLALLFRQLGLWEAVFELLRDQYGTLETILRLTLIPAVTALFIIAFAANVLWTALFGRGWRIMSVALTIPCALLFLWATMAQTHAEWSAALGSVTLTMLPWLAIVKIGALGWLAHRVASHRHYSTSRLVSILAVWGVVVLGVWGLGMRWFPGAETVRLLCAIIVLTPVLGMLAAPLALQVNRTR